MKSLFSEEGKLVDQNKKIVWYETYSLLIVYRLLRKLNIHSLEDAEKFFTILVIDL